MDKLEQPLKGLIDLLTEQNRVLADSIANMSSPVLDNSISQMDAASRLIQTQKILAEIVLGGIK